MTTVTVENVRKCWDFFLFVLLTTSRYCVAPITSLLQTNTIQINGMHVSLDTQATISCQAQIIQCYPHVRGLFCRLLVLDPASLSDHDLRERTSLYCFNKVWTRAMVATPVPVCTLQEVFIISPQEAPRYLWSLRLLRAYSQMYILWSPYSGKIPRDSHGSCACGQHWVKSEQGFQDLLLRPASK